MIILGNKEFSTGMKLAGIKQSYFISTREKGLELLKDIEKDQFIIANYSILKLLPELRSYRNTITFPDDVAEFEQINDLKDLIRSAIGTRIEV